MQRWYICHEITPPCPRLTNQKSSTYAHACHTHHARYVFTHMHINARAELHYSLMWFSSVQDASSHTFTSTVTPPPPHTHTHTSAVNWGQLYFTIWTRTYKLCLIFSWQIMGQFMYQTVNVIIYVFDFSICNRVHMWCIIIDKFSSYVSLHVFP